MKLTDIMSDYEVPRFFKRATGRKYSGRETCINDIRRMLFLFCEKREAALAEKESELAELRKKVRRWDTAEKKLIALVNYDYTVEEFAACKKEIVESAAALREAVGQ